MNDNEFWYWVWRWPTIIIITTIIGVTVYSTSLLYLGYPIDVGRQPTIVSPK